MFSMLTVMLGYSVPMDQVCAQRVLATETDEYKDLKSTHWAAQDLMQLIKIGALDTPTSGTIKPDEWVTRGEAIAVVARAAGISLESNFPLKASDLPLPHHYYKEIQKMVELGMIQNDSRINPDAPVQRDQIAKILSNAFQLEIDGKNTSSFTDLPTNHWAKNIVESLADTGIIKGMTAKTFSPRSNVTRGQLASLTVRGIKLKQQLQNYSLVYDYLAKAYIPTTTVHKSWSNQLLTLINEVRVSEGLHPFTQDPALNQLAIIKAQDMIKNDYFDHTSPFYGDPWDMATLFDFVYVSIGENLARNFTTPEQTLKAWLASPHHRDNLLNAHYTATGIGVKQKKDGKLYIVNLFSTK